MASSGPLVPTFKAVRNPVRQAAYFPILLLFSQPGLVMGPAAWAMIKYLIVAHLVEATAVQLPLCLWAGTPFEESLKWIVQTACIGVPSWLKFLKIANKTRQARLA